MVPVKNAVGGLSPDKSFYYIQEHCVLHICDSYKVSTGLVEPNKLLFSVYAHLKCVKCACNNVRKCVCESADDQW